MRHSILRYLKPLLSGGLLGLGFGFCVCAHAGPTLSPEQVADLYLRTFINHDTQSAGALNDYLRPRYEGRDVVHVEVLPELGDRIVAKTVETFAANPQDKQPLTPELQIALTGALRAQVAAVKRSRCQAVGSDMVQNQATNSRVARVGYVCKIPAIDVKAPDVDALANAESRASLLAQSLRDFTDAARNAPLDREIRGQFDLFAEEAGTPYWVGASPETLLGLIMEALHPEALKYMF
jgi:hypothetical protein